MGYWSAWWTLHAARGLHVGVGGAVPQPLAYTDLSQYARDHGYAADRWDFATFLGAMQAMDRLYMEYAGK